MATKGIILGTCIAIFITSLIFTITGFTNTLKENIITGAAINAPQLATYSIIPLVLSIILGLIVLSIKK
jgi:hypothetical protein